MLLPQVSCADPQATCTTWMSLLGHQGQELPLRALGWLCCALGETRLFRCCSNVCHSWDTKRGFGGSSGAAHSDQCQAVQINGVKR